MKRRGQIQYISGQIFSSGGATLYKNPSDQTVTSYTGQIFAYFILCEEVKKNLNSLQRNKENAKKILLIKIAKLISIL